MMLLYCDFNWRLTLQAAAGWTNGERGNYCRKCRKERNPPRAIGRTQTRPSKAASVGGALAASCESPKLPGGFQAPQNCPTLLASLRYRRLDTATRVLAGPCSGQLVDDRSGAQGGRGSPTASTHKKNTYMSFLLLPCLEFGLSLPLPLPPILSRPFCLHCHFLDTRR